MTNEQIILMERVDLMEKGIIKGTGEMVSITTENGEKQIEMPEEIHTFQHWKSIGYQVKKGEKAKAKFSVWKRTTKMLDENTDSEETNKMNRNINKQGGHVSMFMKQSAFFTADQVEKISK